MSPKNGLNKGHSLSRDVQLSLSPGGPKLTLKSDQSRHEILNLGVCQSAGPGNSESGFLQETDKFPLEAKLLPTPWLRQTSWFQEATARLMAVQLSTVPHRHPLTLVPSLGGNLLMRADLQDCSWERSSAVNPAPSSPNSPGASALSAKRRGSVCLMYKKC